MMESLGRLNGEEEIVLEWIVSGAVIEPLGLVIKYICSHSYLVTHSRSCCSTRSSFGYKESVPLNYRHHYYYYFLPSLLLSLIHSHNEDRWGGRV